jgi:hypothetical protein
MLRLDREVALAGSAGGADVENRHWHDKYDHTL